jgi:hypothetical protein
LRQTEILHQPPHRIRHFTGGLPRFGYVEIQFVRNIRWTLGFRFGLLPGFVPLVEPERDGRGKGQENLNAVQDPVHAGNFGSTGQGVWSG